MHEELLTEIISCYLKFAPKGEIDYRPYAERFLDSYIERLRQSSGEGSVYLLIEELVCKTFLPQEVAKIKPKIRDIAEHLFNCSFHNLAAIRPQLL